MCRRNLSPSLIHVKNLVIIENKADRTSLGCDVQVLIPKQVTEGDSEAQRSYATESKSESVVLG